MRFSFHGEQLDTDKHSIDKEHFDSLKESEQVEYVSNQLKGYSSHLRGKAKECRDQIATEYLKIKKLKKKLAKFENEKQQTMGKEVRMRKHYNDNKKLKYKFGGGN